MAYLTVDIDDEDNPDIRYYRRDTSQTIPPLGDAPVDTTPLQVCANCGYLLERCITKEEAKRRMLIRRSAKAKIVALADPTMQQATASTQTQPSTK